MFVYSNIETDFRFCTDGHTIIIYENYRSFGKLRIYTYIVSMMVYLTLKFLKQ